ncbi:MAG: hypothetical protein EOP21_05380, partial [Hyphomicrobiales bacterium]
MSLFQKSATAALVAVIVLICVGATVRVSGAGMGCPDWPRCWGRLIPPTKVEQVDLSKLDYKKLPLKVLAMYGWRVFKPPAYEALLEIYRHSDERNLYDHVVPPLIKKGHLMLARRWHNLCISRDDVPSDSAASNPIVQILLAE